MFYAIVFLVLCATGNIIYAPLLLVVAMVHGLFKKVN
jgi:hypothetical protein